MRISELSRRSGVPNATIKYYLREGLLPPGRATAATQAEYDETHLRRLRLIRALVGVRGLSVASAKQVLEAMTEHRTDPHEVLGIAFGIRPSTAGATDTAEGDGTAGANPEAAALVDAMGWSVSEHNPARQIIDRTLRTLRSLDVEYDWRALLPYADLAERTARYDLDRIESITDPLEKAERAVLLTFLLEPALMALRRLAQENESTARHGGGEHQQGPVRRILP
ncbi:MerR family transcriptional regulator [Streptomyces marokkonensis]|uniref:MerR family transcriptional regulator n=1 Tax=Streptomyces marokkonensis TaxID=324855 RepID=A0ABW6Q4P0_9ACTN|nr:MerR family transcriptional regulator [Streptomyces marokkonensis]